MSSALRARAVVVADLAGGRPRLRTLRSDPPVALRPAGGAVYLASSAAGPVGGDRVDLDLAVGDGSELEVRTVAATLAWPGPAGGTSTSAVRATVGAGAELRWRPEPTVAVAGCDHRVDARVALDATARLVWREEVVLGRHREPGGSVLQRLAVDRAGRPLLRTESALGPAWPGSLGPAGTAGHRAVGTVLVVGPAAAALAGPAAAALAGPAAAALGARLACSALAGDAVVVSAVAATAAGLRRVLDRLDPVMDRLVDRSPERVLAAVRDR